MRTILQQQQQLDNKLTAIDPPKPFFLSLVPIDSSNINPGGGGEMVVWIDERINVIPQPKAVFNQKKKRGSGSGGGGDGYFLPFTLAGWWGLHKLVIKR